MPPDIPLDALSPAKQAVPESIVPMGSVSIGLMPGEASSVEPSGIPVAPTDAADCWLPGVPSGEVAATLGVGKLIPPT